MGQKKKSKSGKKGKNGKKNSAAVIEDSPDVANGPAGRNVSKLLGELAAAQKDQKDLQEKLDQALARLTELAAKAGRTEALEQQLFDARQSLDDLLEARSVELASLSEQIIATRTHYEALLSEQALRGSAQGLAVSAASKTGYEEEITRLKAENARLVHEAELLRVQIDTRFQEIAKLTRAHEALKAEFKESRTSPDEATSQLQSEVAVLRKDLQLKAGQLERSSAALGLANKEISSLKRRRDQLKSELEERSRQ